MCGAVAQPPRCSVLLRAGASPRIEHALANAYRRHHRDPHRNSNDQRDDHTGSRDTESHRHPHPRPGGEGRRKPRRAEHNRDSYAVVYWHSRAGRDRDRYCQPDARNHGHARPQPHRHGDTGDSHGNTSPADGDASTTHGDASTTDGDTRTTDRHSDAPATPQRNPIAYGAVG